MKFNRYTLLVCFVLAGLWALASCGSIDGQRYMDNKPVFDLREYFSGDVQAWGIVQDRSGDVIRRFDIDIVGSWQGDQGTLVEDFFYYDGETQQRIWRITDLGNGQYQGQADDLLNTANGEIFGNAGRWRYTMNLPVGDKGSTIRLAFDDWMWAMNDGVLMNRSYLKKWGVTVAQVTIFMKKVSEASE